MEEKQVRRELEGNEPQVRLLLANLMHALCVLLQIQHE